MIKARKHKAIKKLSGIVPWDTILIFWYQSQLVRVQMFGKDESSLEYAHVYVSTFDSSQPRLAFISCFKVMKKKLQAWGKAQMSSKPQNAF